MTWKNSRFRKKTSKAFGRRYGIGKGQGGFKFSQVAKDLAWVKSRLNVEKKIYKGSVQDGDVAQIHNNSEGYFAQDITPIIDQGDGVSERNGNSIKLTGFNNKLQFLGQDNCFSTRRLKVHYIKTTDTTSTLGHIIDDVYDINPLTGFRDYFSEFNYTNTKAHRVVMKRNYTVRASSGMDAMSSTNRTKPLGDMNISMKMNDICRFHNNITQDIQDYRIIMVIFCDTGNTHPNVAASNNGVMVQNAKSGLEFKHHYRFWYVDN